MTEWPIGVADLIRYGRPERHFDALDGIKNEQTQLSIENIKSGDVVELSAWAKALPFFKGKEVGAQSVVTDAAKPVHGSIRIGNAQAPLLELHQLIWEAQGCFGVVHTSTK